MALAWKNCLTENFTKLLSWSTASCNFFKANELAEWASTIPAVTTFRVNTLVITVENMLEMIIQHISEKSVIANVTPPRIYIHQSIPECIVIERWDVQELDLKPTEDEVIVDSYCGAAVLRGSHIYAPGVMAMKPGMDRETLVSVYADVSLKCTRGLKVPFKDDMKYFLGNGKLKKKRYEILETYDPKGLVVEMTNPVSGVIMCQMKRNMGIIQNTPSLICVHALDAQPGLTVLDMCAAPGNKTTHIAALMKNEGLLVAIDRTKKIKNLIDFCDNSGITCVKVYEFDSRQLYCQNVDTFLHHGPPFTSNTFDRILLDAPCSGSGLRPVLRWEIQNEKAFHSFARLQKTLAENAVPLLKPGGFLVYSTCSILCEEDECVVAWILDNYPNLELVPCFLHLGAPGFPNCGLDENQRKLVQRFGPGNDLDSVGFFIAKFRKK